MQLLRKYRAQAVDTEKQRAELEATLAELKRVSREMHMTNEKVNEMLTSRRGA